jgi:hypothetical protein
MRTALAVLLCLPLLLPPGVCICQGQERVGARAQAQPTLPADDCCDCCKPSGQAAAQTRPDHPDVPHPLGCPAHPATPLRLVKFAAPVTVLVLACPLASDWPGCIQTLPAVSQFNLAADLADDGPPIYLLTCDLRC